MFGTVQRANDEPPALQVYRIVAGAISRGAYGAGSRLPPERELSTRVRVSRATLRVALRALQDDGLIEPAPGRGWHVTAAGVLEEGAEAMPLSFTEMAAARRLRASAEVLEQRTRTATIEEAEDLGVAPGSDVFCLDRLRKLDDVPIALASARLPVALTAAVVSLDYTSGSLYAALRERCDIHPMRASYVLQAKGATNGGSRTARDGSRRSRPDRRLQVFRPPRPDIRGRAHHLPGGQIPVPGKSSGSPSVAAQGRRKARATFTFCESLSTGATDGKHRHASPRRSSA